LRWWWRGGGGDGFAGGEGHFCAHEEHGDEDHGRPDFALEAIGFDVESVGHDGEI